MPKNHTSPQNQQAAAKFENTPCHLCGADEPEPKLTKRGRSVVQCKRCGLLYTNPRLKNDALFTDVYDVGPGYLRKTERVTKPGRLITYRRFLRELEPFRKTNRILEIGSGFGYFLNEAKAQNWEATGIELSPFSVKHARETYDADVLLGTLEEHFEALLEKGPYDAVALWNVFEHLPDPVGMLRQFNKLLRPGGAVIIKVPDGRAISMKPRTFGGRLWQQEYLRKYFPIHAHMHLVHLTPESFAKMAKLAGFGQPAIHDSTPTPERPTRNLRQALRHRMHIAMQLPYNFVAIAPKIDTPKT
jgi:2-polyprenyl-3-methyl-5-hydroxy-6-metoxy-1,4-benzoquinol methylase